ncbi:MAG: ATP-binding cassette domain-containing protein, partial [Oscillospiraceae bacterium]|nr:ATP-binding cassette domain-containing protein [Oscillospiraceae bacterium]
MLLKAVDVHKVYNGEPLLTGIDLQIEDNDRIGLIGANGCGKSTLLKILLGEILPDHVVEGDGQIIRASKTTVGYLAQSAALDSQSIVWDEMRSVFSELLTAQERMRELEHQLADGDAQTAAEYDRLSGWFLANEGYDIDVKIRTVLFGMGFTDEDLSRQISGFSGGEKTRLSLCKLLLEAPNLLILDDP